MSLIIMVVFGTVALGLGFQIKIKKDLRLIPSLDEKLMNRIRKKNVVASEFGTALFLIALACYITAVLDYFFGKPGMIGGLVLIIFSALNWANLQKEVEHKIKSKKY